MLGVLVLLCTIAAVALADQPNMQSARTELQQARARLQAATHNKGGHRAKALEHVNRAIGYVNQGIQWDRRHNHAASLFVVPDQPNMQVALDHLRDARTFLERATADKGGYRAKALDEVNAAIDETKKGIDAGE
jgi:hypothetical protein